MTRASDLLGPDGPLAALLPGYEVRGGQQAMADAVEATLADERVLFCEAGTGTGKTLAYLLPALLSGKRVVISTATRALQDQLVEKDVPLAERILGRPVRAVVLKGLSNYLCQRRTAELRASDLGAPSMRLKLPLLERWRLDTETGDLSELVGIREDDPLLEAVRSSSDTRRGSPCPHYAECFVTRARQSADAAELVITNHHLFFADLALRGPHPGRVLPDYDAVVFDEAHQLEDVATLFFGVRVSRRRLQTLFRDVERLSGGKQHKLASGTSPKIDGALVAQAERAEESLFAELARRSSRDEPRTLLERDAWLGSLQEKYLTLDNALDGLESSADLARSTPGDATRSSEDWDGIWRRARTLREALTTIVEGAPGRITWLDAASGSPALTSSAVDLSSTLRDRLFDRVPSLVLTSATLTASPARLGSTGELSPFAFARSRLGAYDCENEIRELVVESPFDFKNRALLYLPKDLPAPNDPSFVERAVEPVQRLIDASDGGAFVLTTSLRSMKQFHVLLSQRLGRPVLVQGQAPKHALLASFRQSTRAILVATLSFWEGVDVPGDALRLVILEKVPFSVPTDPILSARARALEAEGGNPFNALFMPLAQMTLKQGFGRLIRTRRDRGVVALLDSRIHTKGYGQRLLSQLPPAKRTSDLDLACEFLTRSKE